VEGIEFHEILFLISRITYIMFILSIVATFDFEIENMDGKTTFLHEDIEEQIYMK
jgi:hypothetical protein